MTTLSGGKRAPNPPKTCIFCGGRPISKEHIYARWLRNYMPETEHTLHHTRSQNWDPETQHVVEMAGPGALSLKGDNRGRGLRVVCEACNNGWMSALQNSAKPAMLPMLDGIRYAPNRHEQRAIAAWATMWTMVAETAHPPIAVIPQSERTWFRMHRKAPPGWMIWVAPFAGLANAGGFHFHSCHMSEGSPVAFEALMKRNTHLAVGAVGRLLFLTFSTRQLDGMGTASDAVRRSLQAAQFIRIHPTVGFRQRLGPVLNDHDFASLISDIAETLINPAGA